jgi:histone deacetylase 1/2
MFQSLFLSHPGYLALRVFGWLCFPNTTATSLHKLAPRSLPCVHLGLSDDHKGYRCFDPSSGRVFVSRHVMFDETTFPYAAVTPPSEPATSPPKTSPTPAILPAAISAAVGNTPAVPTPSAAETLYLPRRRPRPRLLRRLLLPRHLLRHLPCHLPRKLLLSR